MKLLRILGLIALAAGMVGLLGSTIARQVYSSQAQLIQRVNPIDPDIAALTGETGNPVGEPQLMIIKDKGAFLEGETTEGAKLVDDSYLKDKGVYPLQLKTVKFATQMTLLASLVATGVGLAAFTVANRKHKLLETSGG